MKKIEIFFDCPFCNKELDQIGDSQLSCDVSDNESDENYHSTLISYDEEIVNFYRFDFWYNKKFYIMVFHYDIGGHEIIDITKSDYNPNYICQVDYPIDLEFPIKEFLIKLLNKYLNLSSFT